MNLAVMISCSPRRRSLPHLAFGAGALLLALPALAQTASPVQGPPPPQAMAAKQGPPPPAHPLTAAQAHELMQLTGTDKIKQHLVDNVMAYTQRAFPPFVPADVRTDVETSLEKMDVETPTVATYQRYLSTEDAGKIIDFYKTPAGKDLLATTPPLMSELQQATLKQGQATFQSVMERHKTEIEAAEKTYQAEHKQPTLGGPLGPTAPTPGAHGSTSPGGSTAPKKPQ